MLTISDVKRLTFILVIALGMAAGLVYVFFFRTGAGDGTGSEAPAASWKRAYTASLRAIHDGVFAPLDTVAPNATGELQELQGQVRAERLGTDLEKEKLRVASSLFRLLARANEDREKYESRLRRVRASTYDSLRTGESAQLDARRKREFYEDSVLSAWREYVRTHRPAAETLLARLSELEANQ